ncbi:hypothetical protein vfu_B01023 [Vibrio furnissii NCTC 11218]|nr:hypothetical protein vfu_B01023 [Vibrio furnissii NCTC 11218]
MFNVTFAADEALKTIAKRHDKDLIVFISFILLTAFA